MKVKDKIFLVTGAGNGIGKEIALNLLSKGAKVAAADIRKEALEDLKNDAGDDATNLTTHVLDISDKQAVYNLPEEVVSSQGNVDGVINSAGIIQPFVRIKDLDDEAIDRVMNINFYGTLNLTRAFLPYLLKRPEGYIANISSMGGFLPVPGQSVYGASKAAVKLLTEALSAELIDTNVNVSVIFPGATQTNITANSGVSGPKGAEQDAGKQKIPMLSPKEAAEIIIKGIEKNKTRIYTGKDSKMMNLLYRINPGFATKLIAKMMRSLLPK